MLLSIRICEPFRYRWRWPRALRRGIGLARSFSGISPTRKGLGCRRAGLPRCFSAAGLQEALTGARPLSNDTASAQVAELVDAHGSGPCAARREGSSPFLGTNSPDCSGKPDNQAKYGLTVARQYERVTHGPAVGSTMATSPNRCLLVSAGRLGARGEHVAICVGEASRTGRTDSLRPSLRPAQRPTAELQRFIVPRNWIDGCGAVRVVCLGLRHGWRLNRNGDFQARAKIEAGSDSWKNDGRNPS